MVKQKYFGGMESEVFFSYSFQSGGLEPVLINTKKLFLASNYIQFSTNIKTGFNLIILDFISAESC